MKLQLPQVTLVAADTYNYGSAVASLKKSMSQVDFGAVKFLTDIPIEIDGIEVVQIPTMRSKDEYSKFCIKELYKYFDTEYVLVTQHDSWVLDAEAWSSDFLKYDYIAPAWLDSDGRNCGNGGFSMRSKKLQTILGTDENIKICTPEDVAIGKVYRDYLEQLHWIKFPSDEVCDRFGFELREPVCSTFGFHSYFHEPYKKTAVVKRSAAVGDIILIEPVLRYYALKGWNVVVDIPLEFYPLFSNHYFPVKHISQFDSGRIKPAKVINLDLSYEVKPQQNYLKSYFEFAGITDYQLTRPQLYPLVDKKTKLFDKYVTVHLDKRPTNHRNTYGVNWKRVQRHLENLGYTVIQVGNSEADECGLRINTTGNIGLLKFIIAGADMHIGVDSLPAHMALAYNKPSVLLFGSTNPYYIHSDLRNVEIIQGKCPKAYCWHTIDGGTEGVSCAFKDTSQHLQCCVHDTDDVIESITKLHNQNYSHE